CAHLLHDINVLGLQRYVHFLGEKTNPLDYFAACDLFVLMSREDPFPLVMLEAASMGRPILCFEGSGGATEFVENDCGFAVPYLDIEAMASKLLTLLDSTALYEDCARRAKQKVSERHTVTTTAPKLLRVIDDFLKITMRTRMMNGANDRNF